MCVCVCALVLKMKVRRINEGERARAATLSHESITFVCECVRSCAWMRERSWSYYFFFALFKFILALLESLALNMIMTALVFLSSGAAPNDSAFAEKGRENLYRTLYTTHICIRHARRANLCSRFATAIAFFLHTINYIWETRMWKKDRDTLRHSSRNHQLRIPRRVLLFSFT